LVWRPIVVWAQKFRMEEGGEQESMSSWFGDWLRQSHLAELLGWLWQRLRPAPRPERSARSPSATVGSGRSARLVSLIFFLVLVAGLIAGGAKLLVLLSSVTLSEWLRILGAAWLTLARVLTAVALGTLWALPAGLAIGLSPRLSRLLQPVVQVAAAFPAPMIFPLVIAILYWLGVPLGLGSILLMLLGTQWYILFNVIAGAMAIPADLKESTRLYRIAGWQRFRILYLPAVFPHLVTGWATAAGGAWNASIVCEYVTRHGQTSHTHGLGAMVSEAAFAADFPVLAGSVVTMALMVVIFNRQVWRRCYQLAEERYSMNA
jgi:NitT/TauT family transport system permease protein